MIEIKPGQLVTSTAGRDAGAHYVVVAVVDETYVVVADGERRPLKKAKRKNRRHLWVHPEIHQPLASLLESNGKVTDAQVQAALRELTAGKEEVG